MRLAGPVCRVLRRRSHHRLLRRDVNPVAADVSLGSAVLRRDGFILHADHEYVATFALRNAREAAVVLQRQTRRQTRLAARRRRKLRLRVKRPVIRRR
ncbi:MAG: hypothetical protein BroJett003_20590 [Planctomycetota bacterium]|nr:MAG: hypothetical protein BroJett003_20590 [Planctomycetota bacterium]